MICLSIFAVIATTALLPIPVASVSVSRYDTSILHKRGLTTNAKTQDECEEQGGSLWLKEQKNGNADKGRFKCFYYPTDEKECNKNIVPFVWFTGAGIGQCHALISLSEDQCDELDDDLHEWREGECVPMSKEAICDADVESKWLNDPMHPEKKKCFYRPTDADKCNKVNSPFIWFDNGNGAGATCHVFPTTEAGCNMLEQNDYAWLPIQGVCFPQRQKACIFSSHCVWYKDNEADLEGKAHPIPTTPEECAKVDDYGWFKYWDDDVETCGPKEDCRESGLAWVVGGTAVIQKRAIVVEKRANAILKRSPKKSKKCSKKCKEAKAQKEAIEEAETISQCNNALTKSKKGSKEGSCGKKKSNKKSKGGSKKSSKKDKQCKGSKTSKSSKCNARETIAEFVTHGFSGKGQCVAMPTAETSCNAYSSSDYFWNAGSASCHYRTECTDDLVGLTNEVNWIDGRCVSSPDTESGCIGEQYDWYVATGASVSKCHYKDRCMQDPVLDWFQVNGIFKCRGQAECTKKVDWAWNQVQWPQLAIANPFFQLAYNMSICQPENSQACAAAPISSSSWSWWALHEDCRINPTGREACLDLPKIPGNDIVDSRWIFSEDMTEEGCEILSQAPAETLVKRTKDFYSQGQYAAYILNRLQAVVMWWSGLNNCLSTCMNSVMGF